MIDRSTDRRSAPSRLLHTSRGTHHVAVSRAPPEPASPDCCLITPPTRPPTYNQAIAADPRNPLAKFERAAVLMAEERHREALAELAALKVGAWGCAE